MLQLTVPNPCNENWDNMTPDDNGRHCSKCAKKVIDFTTMTTEQIQEIFTQKNTGGICGRFNKVQLIQTQIELPQNILQIHLPLYKRFLVASLLVFSATLFSCEANTTGEPVNMPELTMDKKSIAIIGDTILVEKVVDTIPTKINHIGKPATCDARTSIDIKGDVAIEPVIPIETSKEDQPVLLGAPVFEPANDSVVIETVRPEIMGKMKAIPVNKLKNH